MDEFKWFFGSSYIFREAKSYFSYWVGMVKYKCDLLGHGTLKSVSPQGWIDELGWFFACLHIARKAKSVFNSYWVHIVKTDSDLTFKYWESTVVALVIC